MPLPPDLVEVTAAHLDQLVADREQEGAHLDFKRELATNWDSQAKARFVADVVAFANGGGGDLVFGVDEDVDACAAAVVPQVFASADQEVRRLQDFVLTLIEPRLQGVQVRSVGVGDGHAVIVRVRQSWAAPHRSKVNQHFYVRDGVRNRQLEVPEVGAIFLRSDSQAQRLRDFRTDRLGKIVTGQTPVPLEPGPKLVVHAVATAAAIERLNLDPVVYLRERRSLPVLGSSGMSGVRLNLDGAYGGIPTGGDQMAGYTQHFRQGYFETVWSLVPTLRDEKFPILPGIWYEQEVNRFLNATRAELQRFSVSSEIIVFLSLVGARKAKLAGPSEFGPGFGYSLNTFDRDDVLLPDVLIDAESSVGRGMRPAYDLMCQAAGLVGSENYGTDGEWCAPR